MNRITLVATGHRTSGMCNTNELYRIIERVAPDIIFEEIPTKKFPHVYKGSLSDSLESFTIKEYLKKHPINHFPVDIDINESFFKQIRNDMRQIFSVVDHNSNEYVELWNQHRLLTERSGFAYLNSEHCSDLLDRRINLEKEILGRMNNEQMFQIYKQWRELTDTREKTMIENIYKYSRQNRFNTALFLIGTEHRKSIIEKVSKIANNNDQKLNWIFNYQD